MSYKEYLKRCWCIQAEAKGMEVVLDHGWVQIETHPINGWKRPWCWEILKAIGEGGGRGWDGWIASLTQWTWVWANSRRQWTEEPGMLQSMELQSQTQLSNWTTTDRNPFYKPSSDILVGKWQHQFPTSTFLASRPLASCLEEQMGLFPEKKKKKGCLPSLAPSVICPMINPTLLRALPHVLVSKCCLNH